MIVFSSSCLMQTKTGDSMTGHAIMDALKFFSVLLNQLLQSMTNTLTRDGSQSHSEIVT